MVRWKELAITASLAIALAAPSSASAQTDQRPAKRHSATGRQITVRKATPSYLTTGTGVDPGSRVGNGYVLDTFNQPVPTEGTFTGMRGQERLLSNRFDGPGIPLFRF
jgi:hypothetical protein